jgi:hypothetical protein
VPDPSNPARGVEVTMTRVLITGVIAVAVLAWSPQDAKAG